MQKNPSSILGFLPKITPDVGLIYFRSNELTSEIKELIEYLTDGKLEDPSWSKLQLPLYIFTHQFSSQILISINNSDDGADQFSKDFANGKKILTISDFLP